MMNIAIMAIAGLAQASNYHDITWSNFVTHEKVLEAPSVDLTAFGYEHSLPRVYNLLNDTYDAAESYRIFKEIVSGNRNSTMPKQLGLLSTREENYELHFTLDGSNGGSNCEDEYNSGNPDPSKCYSGNGCSAWYRAIVYSATNAYVTLWQGLRCTDTHKSINPPCPETATRDCDMGDFLPNSYGVKLGCHQEYSSGACKGGLVPSS